MNEALGSLLVNYSTYRHLIESYTRMHSTIALIRAVVRMHEEGLCWLLFVFYTSTSQMSTSRHARTDIRADKMDDFVRSLACPIIPQKFDNRCHFLRSLVATKT